MTKSMGGLTRARRATAAGKTPSTGQFTIPAHIFRAIPPDSLFRAEWHADGILYRIVTEQEKPPEWTKT